MRESKNYLHNRNIKLTLMEKELIQNSMLELRCSNAWVDLMLAVKGRPESESRSFWEDNLNTISELFDELRKIKSENVRLEYEYNKLYGMYSEQVDVNKKLRDEFI